MTTPLKSYSAGQDVFALATYTKCGTSEPLTFLDIGARHPTEGNNTLLLEEAGFAGDAVELNDEYAKHPRWAERPNTKMHHCDALSFVPPKEHYFFLSLDVDHNSTAALCNLLQRGITFNCIAIEHDAYAHGNSFRVPQRYLLRQAGYVLLHADVCFEDAKLGRCAYEDWWIACTLRAHYRSSYLLWQDLVTLINEN